MQPICPGRRPFSASAFTTGHASREACRLLAAGAARRPRRQQLQPRRLALPSLTDGAAPRRPCCSVPPSRSAPMDCAQGGHRDRLLDDRSAVSARWPSAWAVRRGLSRCPVTGGTEGAKAAACRCWLGRTMADLERPAPLEVVGSRITHLGPVGCGSSQGGPNQGWWPAATAGPWPRAMGPGPAAGLPMARGLSGLAQRGGGSWGPGEPGWRALLGGVVSRWVSRLCAATAKDPAIALAAGSRHRAGVADSGERVAAIEDALIEAATGMRTCRPDPAVQRGEPRLVSTTRTPLGVLMMPSGWTKSRPRSGCLVRRRLATILKTGPPPGEARARSSGSAKR